MSILLKNRSILTVLKNNYGPQTIRNICFVPMSGDIRKQSGNDKLKVRKLFWLQKRYESTTNTDTSTSSDDDSSSKFSRDHYDVIIVGGGMVSSPNKFLNIHHSIFVCFRLELL